MDREKATVLIGCLLRNHEFMTDESGDKIMEIVDTEQRRILKGLVDALPPQAGEVGNAVPHKEEQ